MGKLNDVFKTIGASNHTDKTRQEDDYYATDPIAAELLLEKLDLTGPIWEPACGGGHLSEIFVKHGFQVKSTDLIDRGYGAGNTNFLNCNDPWPGDIITNPPYKYAEKFVRKSLDLISPGHYTAMLLKLTFLEGKGRRKLFATYPMRYIYVFSGRLLCAKNGEFEKMRASGGGIQAYAWFVWQKGYAGKPELDWIN